MDQERRNSIIVIVILMAILGVIAFVVFRTPGDYTYQGPTGEFSFERNKIGNLEFYSFEIVTIYNDGEDVVKQTLNLRNGPREVEHIPVEGDVKGAILPHRSSLSEVYLTVDPDSSSKSVIGAIEIGQVIGRSESGILKMYARGALTRPGNHTVNGTMPIISCADAADRVGVIYLEEGAKQGVVVDDNGCVHVRGETPDEVIASADRVIYVLLGIMEG